MRRFLKVLRILLKIMSRVFKILSTFIWLCTIVNVINYVTTGIMGEPLFIKIARTSKVAGAPIRWFYNDILWGHPNVQYFFDVISSYGVYLCIIITAITTIVSVFASTVERWEYKWLRKHGYLMQQPQVVQQPVVQQPVVDSEYQQQLIIMQQQQLVAMAQANQRTKEMEEQLAYANAVIQAQQQDNAQLQNYIQQQEYEKQQRKNDFYYYDD